MKVLVDVNVVLDVFLMRQPWFGEASQIWDAHRNGQIAAAIAAFTVPTVFTSCGGRPISPLHTMPCEFA